jgi:hypothetical protein
MFCLIYWCKIANGSVLKQSEVDTIEMLFLSFLSDNMLPQLERDHSAIILASRKLVNTGNSAGDACRYPQQGGEEFLVPSIPGFLMPEQSQNEIEQKSDIAIKNKLCVWNGHASSIQDSQSPSQAFSNKVHINYAATEHHKTGIDAVVSSEKEKSNVIEKLDDTERKNETGTYKILGSCMKLIYRLP